MISRTELELTVRSYKGPSELGKAAGQHAAEVLTVSLAKNDTVRLMLAAAPSQEATLTTLISIPGIDWTRVECFHMDDYLGLAAAAPQGFANWLERVVFDSINVKEFRRIDPSNEPHEEALRYEHVMGCDPFDLVLCGLGVNGHLAFNDPLADFDDPQGARLIELDSVSRQQQVDEGHFTSIDDVPIQAITVTIPRLLNSACVIASVPGSAKRMAVAKTLDMPISGLHPGTALRTHANAHLYLDKESDPR
jgi:glucosamine-6-phosphate deaminase